MNLAATLFCAVTTLLSVQAITVSVDRADIRPVGIQQPDQSQSMFVNGWRPLSTSYDNIGVNVSPASNLDRNVAPLHPVLGKLQEHMIVSERLKPQRRNKPQQIEYSPPSILGSFAVYASSKQRGEIQSSTEPKPLSTEREYSFLVPPPRDTLRFELEPLKKVPFRDSDPYVRSSQFIPQAIKPNSNSPTYFIKPASYSTAVHPYSQARPFINDYNVQQSLIPPRHPVKQFEAQKSSNDKPYYQPPNVEVSGGFNKDNNNKPSIEQPFERLQPQQAPQQVVNGNFYNQINHPTHYKQSTYERDPSFLVHESHEISYVTPSYKYRPATYHFDNGAPESYSSSTVPPRAEPNKYSQQQTPTSARPEGFKQFQPSPKESEKQHHESHHGHANGFYITDFQKTRYTPDINEVLPKANQPAKFNQVSTTPPPYIPDHDSQKVVYLRPELQQQQYQSSIIPLNINQRPLEVEYETPESISLKHFNEQQFLLQQQLIAQDRQRLREHEARRHQELQRQQQEEINKRRQEIKLLEQKHKEKQRLEQLQTVEPDIVKEIPHRHHFIQQFPVEEQKKIPKEQYKYVHHQQQYELPPITPETPFQPLKEEKPFKQVTVQKFEEVVTPAGTQSTTQEEFQPIVRPYRPQKPFRDPIRRRKPTTVAYEPVPTEAPVLYNPETQESLTEIPLQTTTVTPETTTIPVTERVIRTRRPGSPLRRRRPTTTTQEPSVSSQEFEEEVAKYNSPEIQDFEKKKRVRPVAANHQDNSYDRRPIRKRPSQRVKVYNKEPTEKVPERVKTTEQPFREVTVTENYPQPFLKEFYSAEYIPTSERNLPIDSRETSTESVPIEFYSETTIGSNLEYYEPTNENRQNQYTQREQYTQKVEDNPLEYLFTKTEVNYVEATTTPPPPTYYSPSPTTTTTTTTTTTEPSTTPKPVISTPKATHRMRPVRYGNATRPRFSIKDYKSRMDYKNRLSSSTEASTVTAGPKQRGHKNQQNPADPSFKEPSGRYKYMSRSSYRTTSTTTPTNHQVDDNGSSGPTTDRSSSSSSRFTPKKRINTSHYYRSRVSGGTTSATPGKQDQEHSAGQSTVRPENVFSSSIRKRPTLKSRLQSVQSSDRNKLSTESTEMQAAAETGFFATTTVASSSASLTEAVNEIVEHEESAGETAKKIAIDSDNQEEKSSGDLSDVTMDEVEEKEKFALITEREPVVEDKVRVVESRNQEENSEVGVEENRQATSGSPLDSTTPFDIRHEEELFAKASQSVADLTSSASALYDKPGMFKAVSPAGENRVISAHLKIATDEPTLPIEAFFHEITKKN